MSILYQIEYRILRNTCHFRGKTIYAQARTNGCPRKVKTEPITFFFTYVIIIFMKKLALSLDKILSSLGYAVLVVLYFLTAKGSRLTSVSTGTFSFMSHDFPIGSLAAVFSSMSTIVLICLVVFYRKPGFYTAIAILILRIVKLASGIMRFHASSFPAFFITIVALISVLIIYQRNEKIQRVQEKHKKELIDFTNSIIDAFAVCIDGKDSYTNGHSLRVAKYTRMLALKLGMDEETAQRFYNIALLHDIGKIGIPDEILHKPGKLTESEYDTMKSHTDRGYEILKKVKTQSDISYGAQFHHERFDGKGYPSRLKGERIPIVARIISVADAFDAMSSTRPYRKKLPMEHIIQEIKDCTGTQFDPAVAAAFLELYNEGAFDDIKTE